MKLTFSLPTRDLVFESMAKTYIKDATEHKLYHTLVYFGYPADRAKRYVSQIVNALDGNTIRERIVDLAIPEKVSRELPCSKEPDDWFTTFPNRKLHGHAKRAIVDKVIQTRDKCLDCPVMVQCGELGMREENLTYGIWGGMLAAERMRKAGKKKEDYWDGTYIYSEWKMLEAVENAEL